jgi:hypothetical protein
MLFCPLLKSLSSKDTNFVALLGTLIKKFEVVNDHQLPEIGIYPPFSVDISILIFLLELPYLLFL